MFAGPYLKPHKENYFRRINSQLDVLERIVNEATDLKEQHVTEDFS